MLRQKRKAEYATLTRQYYNLATDLYGMRDAILYDFDN